MNAVIAARAAAVGAALLAGMVHVPAGDYVPLRGMGGQRMHVAAFEMDAHAVTRAEYLAFVRAHPEWQRDRVEAKRADASYLSDWRAATDPGDATDLRRPVTSVSWYAATAYCEAQGKRLPTTDEWEYVAAASDVSRDASHDPAFMSRLLAMYASRAAGAPPPAGHGFRNVYGIEDLHGSAWEWTRDFKPEEMTNCAGAAMGASDPSNYPALLREAFRSALTERSTARMLGFRCAANGPM
ncbi:MAG: formylglycine-generating enzyme family protein [Gemmatimonadales bacterium]